jgi:hypothetical protein
MFEDYLTAFLASGMSVCNGFCYQQDRARNKAIKAWREKWVKDNLTPDKQRLYDDMREARNAEAHIANKSSPARKVGLELCVGQEEIAVVGPGARIRTGRAELRASGLQVSF